MDYRYSELGNCTLHLSRPFLRPPIVPIYKHPWIGALWCYAITVGFFFSSLVYLLAGVITHRLSTFATWHLALSGAFSLAYIALYRWGLPRMAAQKFRDRINGQVPFA